MSKQKLLFFVYCFLITNIFDIILFHIILFHIISFHTMSLVMDSLGQKFFIVCR